MNPTPPLTPIQEQILSRFRHTVAQASAGPSVLRMIVVCLLSLAFAATIIGIPISYILLRRTFAREDAANPTTIELAERAVPVVAYPLMVNSALRQPGNITAPGLVMITFDRAGFEDPQRMAEIALRLLELSLQDPDSSPDAKYPNDLFNDEEFQRNRRRKLPVSLSGGLTVYVCDLMINQTLLKNRHIGNDDALDLICLATPGDSGRIDVLPSVFLEGLDLSPPGSPRQPRHQPRSGDKE